MAELINIQRGSATLAATVGSASPSVSSYTAANCILEFSIRGANSDSGDSQVTGSKPTSTTLNFARTDTDGTIEIEWELKEYDTDVDVQDVSFGASGTTAISAVTLAQSFCVGLGLQAGGSTFGSDDNVRLYLPTTTTVGHARAAGTTTGNVQVVDWTGASVQAVDNLLNNVTTDSDTITSVNTSQTLLHCSGESAANLQMQHVFAVGLTNATTISYDSFAAIIGAQTLTTFVVELDSEWDVQRGNLTATATTENVTLTAVDTSLTWCHLVTATIHPSVTSVNVADDDFQQSQFTVELTSSTNLQLVRDLATNNANVYWETIEYVGTPASAPAVVDVTSDKPDATYGAGEDIYVCVEFDEAVDVTGTPQLNMDVTAGGRQADFAEPWTPAEITTQCWYDASDLSTITESAGLVSQWDDKSGNNLHLTQGTGAQQPETGTDTMYGLNTLVFVDDDMSTSSNPFGASVSNAAVFMVMRATVAQGISFTLTGGSGVGNVNRWQSHTPWNSGVMFFDCGGTSGTNRVTGGTLANDEEAFLSFYCSTTDSVQEIRKNGTVTASDATGHTVNTIGNIFVGSGGAATRQDMELGEMIIINGTVSTAVREQIEGYLAWKWGLEANLPTGHTYENRPPLLS